MSWQRHSLLHLSGVAIPTGGMASVFAAQLQPHLGGDQTQRPRDSLHGRRHWPPLAQTNDHQLGGGGGGVVGVIAPCVFFFVSRPSKRKSANIASALSHHPHCHLLIGLLIPLLPLVPSPPPASGSLPPTTFYPSKFFDKILLFVKLCKISRRDVVSLVGVTHLPLPVSEWKYLFF